VDEKNGYDNRSEAIRDFIRDKLVEEEWKDEQAEVVAILTLVYDHESRETATSSDQHPAPALCPDSQLNSCAS